jgi:thiosulfate/3-mercaptopyruvate sulfurtransferase
MTRRSFGWTMSAGLTVVLHAAEPWTDADVRQPESLAKDLQSGRHPLILYVGFPILYKGAHIPGAILAGPGSQPNGLDAMQHALAEVPKDREIVLYCGCCPFDHCPNIRPAFEKIREWGYSKVSLVVMPTNFHTDWVEKGYPVEKPAS